MENLNMYEEPPVANQVTIDALGNTNQDIYNNPFGDFNNQLISDVAIGKSTEITDLVMQQQPDNNAFCNLTDTMNNINNNKFNNGHDEDNFMVENAMNTMQVESPQLEEQNVLLLNDDNNNSNDNLGPETDVDAIDEEFQFNAAVGGDKEKTQMEFKETEDVADRAEIMNFAEDQTAAIYGTLENKIFEELSLQNPDLLKGNNPFSSPDDVDPMSIISEVVGSVAEFIDNKLIDQEEVEQLADDYVEKMEDLHREALDIKMELISEAAAVAQEAELISANDDDQEAVIQHELPEADLGFVESSQQVVGESGGEDSEDEWNYVKVDKKLSDGLAAVEETTEPIIESPVIEHQQETGFVHEEEKANEFEDNNFEKVEKHEETFEEHSSETVKDVEQEAESEIIADEERHVQDEVEKDLQLSVETEDFDEMSQLNPDAKEFVPVSPTRSNGPMSPPLNGNAINTLLNNFVAAEEAVMAQSPRKGDALLMEDDHILIPSENEFDKEAESRPHEINVFAENGFQRIDSPELLNLKESMQKDDKLEQEYKDEAQPFFEEEKLTGNEYKALETSFTEYSNGFQNNINSDPMSRSFYEGRDNGDILTAPARNSDVLNSVQPIPTFEDEQPEADHQITESETPESDWNVIANVAEEKAAEVAVATGLLGFAPMQAMDSSDNFEAEQFVEEIKSANSEFDKYVDQELSPTLPEVSFNTIQAVEEINNFEKSSLEQVEDASVVEPVALNIVSEEQQIEISPVEISSPVADFAEQLLLSPEPVIEKVETEVKEEPKVEALSEIAAGAAVVAAAAGAVGVAAIKKKPATAGSKTEVKKTDVKAKAPAAAKTSTVPAKKPTSAPTPATRAPISKPTTAAAPAKPLPIKKVPSTTTAKPAPKPASTLLRPKLPTTSVPPIKRPVAGAVAKTVTDSSAKPAPISKAAALTKKPATTVSAVKAPAARPVTSAVPSKPKLANGTTTERKPLASSAPISRAAPKPTTLSVTAKPKPNGTSSTLSTTRTVTSATRLTDEKAATSPLKEKLLNRSVGSATRSPRPATSAGASKDLKSPSSAVKGSPSLSAIGAKKPLSAVKKSPISTSTTTVTKKSPTKVTGIKKTTTTTTVVSKKVVNGDVVSEQTTTTTTSGDPQLIEDILKDGLASELNGHTNGNGHAEHSNDDNSQVLIDSADV